jgi:hypothetical protein
MTGSTHLIMTDRLTRDFGSVRTLDALTLEVLRGAISSATSSTRWPRMPADAVCRALAKRTVESMSISHEVLDDALGLGMGGLAGVGPAAAPAHERWGGITQRDSAPYGRLWRGPNPGRRSRAEPLGGTK